MGRVARSFLVLAAALICGAVALVLTLWIMVLVDSHTVLGSCGTVTASGSRLICTPRSAWSWLPLITAILGGAAGGYGVSLITRRRKPSSGDPRPQVASA